jgi:hypothetical protein
MTSGAREWQGIRAAARCTGRVPGVWPDPVGRRLRWRAVRLAESRLRVGGRRLALPPVAGGREVNGPAPRRLSLIAPVDVIRGDLRCLP